MYKPLFSVLICLMALPAFANTRAQATPNEPLPKWFLENVEIEKRKGCSDDWSKFYWAKRLPASRLKVGCMLNGHLIVAPSGSLGAGMYVYSATIPNKDWGAPDLSVGAFFDIVVSTGSGWYPYRVLTAEPSALAVNKLNFIVINKQGKNFCVIEPKNINKLVSAASKKDSLPDIPIFCGDTYSGKPKISSIHFSSCDNVSSLVRIHSGVPMSENPVNFSKKAISFVKSIFKATTCTN